MRPSPVLFACLFAAQAAFLTLAPVLPHVAADFGVSLSAAGQLATAAGASGAAAAVAITVAGARIAVRPLLLGGLALIASGSAASALAPTYEVLLGAQLLLGAGMAAVLAGAVAAVPLWAPEQRRPAVLAWALLGQPASWVAGMPVIGLVTHASWRLAWLAVPAAASLLAAAAVALTQRGDAHGGAPERALGADGSDGSQDAWRRPAVRGWALGELLCATAWNGTLVYAGALLVASYGLAPGICGLLLGASALAYFPATLVARRYVARHARALVVGLGGAAAAFAVLLGAVRPAPAFTVAVLATMMALQGARGLAGSVLGLEIAPDRRVQVTGLRAAALQSGSLLGAALGGAALAHGGWPLLGGVLALAFALATVPHVLHGSHASGAPRARLGRPAAAGAA